MQVTCFGSGKPRFAALHPCQFLREILGIPKMITYFVTGDHRYTMDEYLDNWGDGWRSMIQIRAYSEFASLQWLPGGTYIFSDLERLTPALSRLVADVWAQLEAAGPSVRLLNHSLRALRRSDLLNTLHTAKRNDFNAYRLTDDRSKIRFPAFVRVANDHEGSRTGLLNTHEDIDANLRAAMCFGHDPRDLLIVEYLNAADADGIFHKYSAFRVGDQIVPRNLMFSRQWVLKKPDLLDGDKISRQREFLETNPHATALLETFNLAHLEYGRCDYSVINGRLQVWEINSNPIIMRAREEYPPVSLANQEFFAHKIRPAFEAVDLPVDPQLKIPIRFDRASLDCMVKG